MPAGEPSQIVLSHSSNLLLATLVEADNLFMSVVPLTVSYEKEQ